MSLQDRLASQNAIQLMTIASSLSLVTVSLSSPTAYNFPIFLFGIVAHEMHSSNVPFRQFLSLVAFTAFFDLLAIPTMSLFSLRGICSFAVLLLKAPIFFTCLAQLRERGDDLSWGTPAAWRFQGLGQNQGGQNWSMPGGFGAGGNQNSSSAPTAAPAPGSFPSSGGFRLGGEDDAPQQTSGGPPPGPAPGRNGYQTIA